MCFRMGRGGKLQTGAVWCLAKDLKESGVIFFPLAPCEEDPDGGLFGCMHCLDLKEVRVCVVSLSGFGCTYIKLTGVFIIIIVIIIIMFGFAVQGQFESLRGCA